ncbi:MAG: aminoacetone oxidase family FAD-binding enzyme [Firmicutes bacterium HGW-Firmicutes-15]|nr:MAG: aminoacetone oxidase family FAD-binding enzyme [Firmicutes bacterium HGW-Firmicutes-15]
MKPIIVIGAGPAGMMAAITAANQGAAVTIVEKKDSVGRKLSITGKGRCNLTSSVDKDELIKGFPGNGRFLFSAFHEFSNLDVITFFEQRGLKTKVERGNRVFPESDNAEEVVGLLYENMKRAGVKIQTATAVQGIAIESGKVVGVNCERGRLPAEAVIIATGGMSYPGTGSTGDGYQWAAAAGHSIVEPRPGLVPLMAREEWVKDLQGLSLKNTKATAYNALGKKINEDCGELLFTHFGLSGPIILSMSHGIGGYLYQHKKPVTIELDLKPALSEEKLDERLQRDLNKYSRKIFKNALDDLLPQKLIPVIIRLSGIDSGKACHQINRGERLGMVHLLKHLQLTIYDTRPIAEAIVTAGGVNVKEIDPKTMQSKLVQGLFLAGEVLDIDGYTGGYNLQAAFSTGYLAGKCAAL